MEKQITILAVLLGAVLLVLGLAIGYIAMPEKVVTNTITTAPAIEVTQVEYNDTAIKADVAKIQATLDEDTIWEVAAEKLATEEWTASKYKDIFNAMNVSLIEDKEDISKVTIIDTTFSGMDVDEQDATVTQDVKVYYEDLDGDNKKIYLTIVTTIEENDVEDQVISVTA